MGAISISGAHRDFGVKFDIGPVDTCFWTPFQDLASLGPNFDFLGFRYANRNIRIRFDIGPVDTCFWTRFWPLANIGTNFDILRF